MMLYNPELTKGHLKLAQMESIQAEFSLWSSTLWATETTTFVLEKGVNGSSFLRFLHIKQVQKL